MVQKIFFALLGLLTLATCQIAFPGKCNSVTTQQNFDLKNYMGLWYEIKRYEAIFQLNGECSTADYALTNDAERPVSVNNTYVNLFGKRQTILGYAHEANPGANDGKFKVVFPSVGSPEGDYWVLGTDYKNYTVIWACAQITNVFNLQFAWVLSRQPSLSSVAQAEVNNILTRNNIDQTKFRTTKQDERTCGNRNDANTSLIGVRSNSVLFFAILTIKSLIQYCLKAV